MTEKEICRKFTCNEVSELKPLGDGHINDTYLALSHGKRYVLQRLQGRMDISKLEHNYTLYSKACEEHAWRYPKWISSSEGKYFYTDENGDNWRMYEYIDGDILDTSCIKDKLFECGKGLAVMHSILASMEAEPVAVYPMHHDLKYYHNEYKKIIRNDGLSADNRDSLLEKKIEKGIEKYLSLDKGPLSVIHADPKLDNILFKEGKVIGFIDLDTVMVGSVTEDIADCIRSCCVHEGKIDHKASDMLLDGYTSIVERELSDRIMQGIPDAVNKICFELALRYYTDVISTVKKFKEKYPGYRLKRAEEMMDLEW